ncbi:hypothetical protein HMN09_00155500 [Mycena chlorophos]|uniref:Uncharacterized protein n=1 Tax=Mycena chlorophos TaxID=658473 RepID=A0A8H6WKS2_MYCCL|nr:hypothetical protein HMN09_00155500 [Mycena chlorophos]
MSTAFSVPPAPTSTQSSTSGDGGDAGGGISGFTTMNMVYILVLVGVLVVVSTLVASCVSRRIYINRRRRMLGLPPLGEVPPRPRRQAEEKLPPKPVLYDLYLDEKQKLAGTWDAEKGNWDGLVPLSANYIPSPSSSSPSSKDTAEDPSPEVAAAPLAIQPGPSAAAGLIALIPRRTRILRPRDAPASVAAESPADIEMQPRELNVSTPGMEPLVRVACVIAMPAEEPSSQTTAHAHSHRTGDEDDEGELPWFELGLVDVEMRGGADGGEGRGEAAGASASAVAAR